MYSNFVNGMLEMLEWEATCQILDFYPEWCSFTSFRTTPTHLKAETWESNRFVSDTLWHHKRPVWIELTAEASKDELYLQWFTMRTVQSADASSTVHKRSHSLTHLLSLHPRWPRVSGNSRAPGVAAAILQDNDKLVQNVSACATCGSQKHRNTINWPWAAWPAVSAASPSTGKRTRGDVSRKRDSPFWGVTVFFSSHRDSTDNHLVTFHIILQILRDPLYSRTLSQLSMGVTPGLPLSPFSSLAPAMPGTPGNPWEQPSPPQLPWKKTNTCRQQRASLIIQGCHIIPNTTAGTWIYLVSALSGVLRKLVRSSGVLRKTKSHQIKVVITFTLISISLGLISQ